MHFPFLACTPATTALRRPLLPPLPQLLTLLLTLPLPLFLLLLLRPLAHPHLHLRQEQSLPC